MTDTFFGADVMATVAKHRRRILVVAAALTGLAVFLGGAWFAVLQPARRTASLQFVMPFSRTYPSGLPFTTSDIVAPSIAAEVHRVNEVGTYCEPEEFRSGFYVEEHSFELQALEAEFRGAPERAATHAGRSHTPDVRVQRATRHAADPVSTDVCGARQVHGHSGCRHGEGPG